MNSSSAINLNSCLCLCLLLLTSIARAQSQQPLSLLVNDKLQYQAVGLAAITDSDVGFFDRNWSYQQLPRLHVLQIRNIEQRQVQPFIPSPRQGLLILTDGQRFIGAMQLGAKDKDTSVLHWHSPILGAIAVSLDRVKAIHFAPITLTDGRLTGDKVQLANGDQLSGFLLGISEKQLELELGQTRTATKLPMDQVTSIRLANPNVTVQTPRQRLYLVDGTVLLCNEVQLTRQSLFVTGTDWQQQSRLPLREIVRIDLASPGHQLVSLANQPHTLVGGAQAFGVDFPPSLSDQAIALHAPTTMRFDLPAGATRLAAEAVIDWQSTDPPQARNWTDFQLTLKFDDKPVFNHAFNIRYPQARINLPIPAGSKSLTVQILPGVNGPVMDRLRLAEPVLLIQRGPN